MIGSTGSLLAGDSNRFSCRRMGGTRVFRKGHGAVQLVDLLHWIVETETRIDVYDLLGLLEQRYGVVLPFYTLTTVINGFDLYYDTIRITIQIIDGNRRFTCLRELASDDNRFGYFEVVILDRSIESNAKQIKLLELSIQHGEERKVDYDPIDRLVGIYNDILKTHLLSVEEYARSTNDTVGEVKRRVELAQLMVEFLDFINASAQFHIARDLQIYYPLEELQKLLRKVRTEDESEDLKNSVFVNILMGPIGDMTRFVRNYKNIIGTEHQDSFFEEQRKIAAQVIDMLPPPQEMSIQVIREQVRTQEELGDELERSMDKYLTRTKKTETRNRPIQMVEKATSFLESIDINILRKLGDSELLRLRRQLELLEQALTEIRENLP